MRFKTGEYRAKAMHRNLIFLQIVVLSAGWLNLGAILQDDDPILKTQAEAIRYDKKMEDLKDGEKGAPAPSFRFYHKDRFFTEDLTTEGQRETEISVLDEEFEDGQNGLDGYGYEPDEAEIIQEIGDEGPETPDGPQATGEPGEEEARLTARTG